VAVGVLELFEFDFDFVNGSEEAVWEFLAKVVALESVSGACDADTAEDFAFA